MLSIEEAILLTTLEDIAVEIKERDELITQMVGQLYPAIFKVRNHAIEIQSISFTIKNQYTMQEQTVNGWQLWDSQEELPESAIKFIIQHDILKFAAQIYIMFYKDDEWMMVTDSASAYRHRAKWMIWHKTYQLCAWSDESMRATVVSLMYNLDIPKLDPEYETWDLKEC